MLHCFSCGCSSKPLNADLRHLIGSAGRAEPLKLARAESSEHGQSHSGDSRSSHVSLSGISSADGREHGQGHSGDSRSSLVSPSGTCAHLLLLLLLVAIRGFLASVFSPPRCGFLPGRLRGNSSCTRALCYPVHVDKAIRRPSAKHSWADCSVRTPTRKEKPCHWRQSAPLRRQATAGLRTRVSRILVQPSPTCALSQGACSGQTCPPIGIERGGRSCFGAL